MFDGENMIERFFETLKTDETIFSSLSQIGLLSLIVIVSFFCLPSPVTTTSSTAFIFSSCILMLITLVSPFTKILTVLKPIYEKTNV